MDKKTLHLTDETRALEEAYEALNRNDIAAFVEILDPQVERIEFAGLPGGGTYNGFAEVKEHISKGRGSWAEGCCKPERFMVIGNRIIVSVDVHVRLKHETEWRKGRVTDVYTFRDGKAIQFCSFLNEQEAIEWAEV